MKAAFSVINLIYQIQLLKSKSI